LRKKVEKSECIKNEGISVLRFHGKVYAKCFEKRYYQIIKLNIEDTRIVFVLQVPLQTNVLLSSKFLENA